jgi:hypothetical protein
MAGKWLKSSRLAGKPFFRHYSGTLSGANGFNTPSPLFQQNGWNPMTPAIDPSGGTTIPFRLDTAPGPLLDGDCVNDPRPRLDHAPGGMQQRRQRRLVGGQAHGGIHRRCPLRRRHPPAEPQWFLLRPRVARCRPRPGKGL